MTSTSSASQRPFIVVGIDGSEASAEALRWAVRQAALTGAELRAVISWRVPVPAYGPAPLPDGANYAVDARQVLHDTIRDVVGTGPDVDLVPITVEGVPDVVLLEAAQGAELLVVGNRGHGALTSLILGSVSEHLVTHATCPVVVVHHQPA
jgi:nucleotide-binding universal stress UspA family protein